MTRVVLTELGWKACTLKYYSMQLENGLDWDHGTLCLDSSNVPPCYQSKSYNVHTMCLLNTKVSLKNLQCVCLLPKCPLRAYNMSTSFTYERPLEWLSLTVSHQTSPWLSTKCPLKNKVHTHPDMLSNCNWGNQAQLVNSNCWHGLT